MADELLTVPEVAERLRCTRKTVHSLILSGRLPGAMRLDRVFRVPEGALASLLVVPAVSVVDVPAPWTPPAKRPAASKAKRKAAGKVKPSKAVKRPRRRARPAK